MPWCAAVKNEYQRAHSEEINAKQNERRQQRREELQRIADEAASHVGLFVDIPMSAWEHGATGTRCGLVFQYDASARLFQVTFSNDEDEDVYLDSAELLGQQACPSGEFDGEALAAEALGEDDMATCRGVRSVGLYPG